MATWQELLIPTIGTLGGVTVTALVQMINTRTQRVHERGIRLLDEKKSAYRDFVNIVKRGAKAQRLLIECNARLEATIRRMEEIAANSTVTAGEFDDDTKRLLNEEKEPMDDVIIRTANEVTTFQEEMRNVNEKLNESATVINFLGSRKVVGAAHSLVDALTGEWNEQRYNKRVDKFMDAARQDLGTK